MKTLYTQFPLTKSVFDTRLKLSSAFHAALFSTHWVDLSGSWLSTHLHEAQQLDLLQEKCFICSQVWLQDNKQCYVNLYKGSSLFLNLPTFFIKITAFCA